MNLIYIFELKDEELNVVKIITVKYATLAVAKRKTEKKINFMLSLRNYISCIFNCDDLLCILLLL